MEVKTKNNNYVWIIFLLGIIIMGIGIFYFVNSSKEEQNYATFMVDGEVYKSDILIEDGFIKRLPETPKKEGYVFDYWEYDGKKYNVNDKIDDDVTLKAVFKEVAEEEVVIVTFDKENDEDDSTIEVIKNEKVSSIQTPEKEGYKFLGWYLNNEKYDFNEEVTKDITLKAKWEVIKYTVKFNSDGGSTVKDQSVEYGKKINTPNNPAKTGYKFLGWYLNDKKYDFNTIVTKDISLTAKWEVVKYTVKFNSDGGSTVNEQKVEYGKKVTTPNNPTKSGYKFLGWYLNDKKYDFNEKITKDISLTAKWEKVENNVESKVSYGDVNEDGLITMIDIIPIEKYLLGQIVLSAQAKKNADINGDGKVNRIDSILLLEYVSGWDVGLGEYKEDKIISEPIKDYVMYGDVNEDGLITMIDIIPIEKYLLGETVLSAQAKKNADINGDGKVNRIDSILLLEYVSGWDVGLGEYKEDKIISEPIKDYVMYGDVNSDGFVNNDDLTRLQKYVQNSVTLTNQEKKNADVNADGSINNTDVNLLSSYISSSSYKPDGFPPNNPLK